MTGEKGAVNANGSLSAALSVCDPEFLQAGMKTAVGERKLGVGEE